MENLEGLWTVYFRLGFFGTGVAVFKNNRLLGGDTYYYYDGNFKLQDNRIEAKFRVVRFNLTGAAVFGNLDSFNLNVSGDVTGDEMQLHGKMLEQPDMKISINCKKMTGF
ncbi:MAG: hypothetical protein ACLP51_01675 [Syntrophobacteraceae bacterium]